MQTWQSRLNARKLQFLTKTKVRLAEVVTEIDELAARRTDFDALAKANKVFHQLAGAGGIYEMAEFCNIAIAAEQLCTKLLMHKAPVGQMEQAKLRAFCDGLLREIAAEEEKSAAVTEDDTSTVDGAQRKFDVLLADANADRLVGWHRIFEEGKNSVRTVKTASGARGALVIRVPDVLVINGPLADSPYGFEVIQQLRSLPQGEKTVVLIVSPRAEFKDKVDAIKCGANSMMEGEFDAREVLVKAQEMLQRTLQKNFKILSVEDDLEQAYFIKSTLESAGYTVLHISDPANFEEALDSFAPDLVLLDIILGEISGHDLARFVRQHEHYSRVPIVFLTTENQLNMHVESARVGGDEHLIKPIAPQLLVASIAGRLERER